MYTYLQSRATWSFLSTNLGTWKWVISRAQHSGGDSRENSPEIRDAVLYVSAGLELHGETSFDPLAPS